MHLVDILSSAEKVGVAVLISSVLPFVFLIVTAVINSTRGKDESIQVWPILAASFVFGLFAFVFALTMSASRTGAVGQVLPAALAFIGGVALWVVTKKEGEPWVVFSSIVSFSALFLMGTVLGSYERQRAMRQSELSHYDLATLKSIADAEWAINIYRKSKGLEPVTLSKD
ncbi:MAG: hypothetical protein AAFR73_05520 [Pseudomonadota bacterium]